MREFEPDMTGEPILTMTEGSPSETSLAIGSVNDNAETVAAIAAVIANVDPVGKEGSGKNTGRRINAVIDSLNRLVGLHGLTIIPAKIEILREQDWGTTQNGAQQYKLRLLITYEIHGPGGGVITGQGIGEGVDTQDKAVGIAQSYALKYFLGTVFLIPFDDVLDPEDQAEQVRRSQPVENPMTDEQQAEILDLFAVLPTTAGDAHPKAQAKQALVAEHGTPNRWSADDLDKIRQASIDIIQAAQESIESNQGETADE